MNTTDLTKGPLTGFKVVEACQMISGPLAAMLLADLGADVVKVEEPKLGDRFRWAGTSVRQMSTRQRVLDRADFGPGRSWSCWT